ncbi:nitroreductase [Saccharospirillum impatiens]|uniref:nitroreductase n=1 Tax=Saccharospirillum impatiens TaxID=169438 RepID=UPI0004077DB7|nr:nitroreductase [Saccharospirillum impatiens]
MSTLFDALQQRRSTRRFLNRSVEQSTLERILTSARRAPSGANLQPGFVHMLAGDPLAQLSERLCMAFEQSDTHPEEYDYFPQPMPAYLKARQREVGYALYNSLGIARRDIPGRLAQHRRNFQFFDAPVGLVITIERAMGKGCYMDLGMFIQSIFLAAQGEGVDSCGIGALASYHHIIRDQLDIPDNEVIVCGMALGYGDPQAPENQFETPRAPLDEYARFFGF